eukprot:tig00000540_g1930.t1
MRLLCSDGAIIECPGALAADSELLVDVSECSDAQTAAVPVPLSSPVLIAAGIALRDPSAPRDRPFSSLEIPRNAPRPQAAAALSLVIRLACAAEFLRAPKLARACAELAEGAVAHEEVLAHFWNDPRQTTDAGAAAAGAAAELGATQTRRAPKRKLICS